MDYSRQALADHLAADYVTGTLRGPARRRFEKLLPAHPSLRTAVDQWQARLMPLTLGLQPQKPPAVVWTRIEQRIGGAPSSKPAAAQRSPWWSQLFVWRGLSVALTVAAVSLSVLLANPGPAQPPVVVVLSATSAPAGGVVPATFVASISSDGRAMQDNCDQQHIGEPCMHAVYALVAPERIEPAHPAGQAQQQHQRPQQPRHPQAQRIVPDVARRAAMRERAQIGQRRLWRRL